MADRAAAVEKLRSEVIPNLEASTAFRLDQGDNLERMGIVRSGLDQVVDWLESPDLDAAAAHSLRALAAVLETTPGYKRARGRNPRAFAKTKLGLARAGIDETVGLLTAEPPPPPPPPPKPAKPSLFAAPGVMVENASAWPPEVRGPAFARNGGKWVAVQVHRGTNLNDDSVSQLTHTAWTAQARGLGLALVAWGWNEGRPEDEVALIADLHSRFRFAGYIANAEAPYKADAGGDPSLSERFVAAFKAKLGDLPLALSSFGAASAPNVFGHVPQREGDVFHYGPWHDAGAFLLAQGYLNMTPVLDPVECTDHAKRAGWPLDRLGVTVGLGDWSDAQRAVSGAEYVERLRQAVSRGLAPSAWSIYLGERSTDAEVDALGSLRA
jgi:hypothetical protein